MDSQIIHDSAPSFDSDFEIESSPSSLVPIVEASLEFDEVVEDTPERVKNHIIKQEANNLKGRKLKFDNPIGLFRIPEVVKDSLIKVKKHIVGHDPRNLKAKRLKIDDPADLFQIYEVVEESQEKVKKHIVEQEPGNLEAERLKFDDPTGLLHIFLPQFFN